MTRIGTSYFVSKAKAIHYYWAYEDNAAAAVERKLAAGEIHIGKPDLKPGQTLQIIDDGTRYAIEERDSVIRHVATFVNASGQRTLMSAAQGRNTFETREAAQAWIDAVTSNNSDSSVRQIWGDNPQFEVRECPCWPRHFDPQTVWFD